jgi:serine phosphatase RsbU (regulator of sigma subunit)/TPR repeat protein
MLKIILTALLPFAGFCLQAQANLPAGAEGIPKGQAGLDSLFAVWEDKSQADSIRAEAFIDYIYDGYFNSQPDSAIVLADQLLKFSQKTEYKIGMVDVLSLSGYLFFRVGNYPKALDSYQRGLKISEEINDKIGTASILIRIGFLYHDTEEIITALKYYQRSLNIYEEINYLPGIGSIYNEYGSIYRAEKDYSKALDYYLKSIAINDSLNDAGSNSAMFLNIGDLYLEQKDFIKALDYFNKGLIIYEKTGDKLGIASGLAGIGDVYSEQGNIKEALEYLQKSLSISEQINDNQGSSSTLLSLGDIYYNQGNYSESLRICKKSLALAKKLGDIGDQQSSCDCLYLAYKAVGNLNQALIYHELMMAFTDSLQSKETSKKLLQMEFSKQLLAANLKSATEEKLLDAQIQAQLSELKHDRIKMYALYGGISLLLIFAVTIFNRFKKTQKQKFIIEKQKEEVERAHAKIKDSIVYAQRIQKAILPPNKIIKGYFKDSFVLYKPKDVVAGDFYWMEAKENIILFAAADCTGHGVPGAIVSVLCNNGLNRSVREYGLTDPGMILGKTREIVVEEFEKSEEDVKDGMDIALCSLDLKEKRLKFAGAHNPLWIIRNGELNEIKADKQPIGKFDYSEPFTTHSQKLESGDSIYMFSDGFADQFGGPKGKKFLSKNLKKLILSIQKKSMNEQKLVLDEAFESYRGKEIQLDDVCIFSVKV